MDWIKKSITRIVGLAIFLFIFFLFSIYFYFLNVQVGNYFERQSKERLVEDCEHISKEIEMYLQKYTVIVEQAKKNPDFINIAKEIKDRYKKRENPLYNRVTNQLKEIIKLDNNIALAFIGLPNVNDLVTNIYEYDTRTNYDFKKREWYIKAIQEDKTTITFPYVDLVTGKVIITIATPIIDGGQIIGVFGLDIRIEDIGTMMRNYSIGDDGYAALVYKDGKILYHPEYDTTDPLNNVFLNDLFGELSNELLSGKRGITSYTYKEHEKYIAFLPVRNTDLTVFTIIPKSEVFYQLNKFVVINLSILIGLIIVTAFFLIFLENFIATPVVRISRQIENYSNQNNHNKSISLPKKFLSRKDEIGILSRGLTFMLQEISDYVLKIEEKNQELLKAKERTSMERFLFKTTIHSLSDGVISTDEFGNIRIMNVVAENLTGWSRKEAKEKGAVAQLTD